MNPDELSELRYPIHWAVRRAEGVLASCYGKRGFDNPQEASKAIRHPGIGSYRCQHCGHWHVGSNNHPRRLGGKLRIKRGVLA